MENQNPMPPELPKSKDGILSLIGFFVFGYMFISMIMSFAGMFYGALNSFVNFLYIGIYAIPFLLSFAVQKKSLKTMLLIFGIVTLVMGLWKFVYSTFMMSSYYYGY